MIMCGEPASKTALTIRQCLSSSETERDYMRLTTSGLFDDGPDSLRHRIDLGRRFTSGGAWTESRSPSTYQYNPKCGVRSHASITAPISRNTKTEDGPPPILRTIPPAIVNGAVRHAGTQS